jgi:NADH-quinone oxidoreductase subunit C
MGLENLVARLREKFPDAVLDALTFRGEDTLQIRPQDILPVCRYLWAEPDQAYDFLTDLCGVDDHPREPRFQIVYHLFSLKTKNRLRLKVALPEADPRVASVVSIWKAADWMEREAFDMFGIKFEGHPDLRRILLTPDWTDYPLRKDFPLRGRGEEALAGDAKKNDGRR